MAQSRLGSQKLFAESYGRMSAGDPSCYSWNWDPIISQANGKWNRTNPKCCFEDTLSKNTGKTRFPQFA